MSRTSMVILASLCALGIYDLYVVASGDFEDSISKFWQNSSFSSPMVSFIAGAICGHFFFYMPHSSMTEALKQQLISIGWIPPKDNP